MLSRYEWTVRERQEGKVQWRDSGKKQVPVVDWVAHKAENKVVRQGLKCGTKKQPQRLAV
jgi:hypothetical protein